MKANELMIGDWVLTDMGEQMQVCEIHEDEVMLDYNDMYDYADIEPIPLTKEILENNGFSRHEDEYQLLDDYWELYLEEINDGMWQVVEYNDEFGVIPMQVVNISHIHELQHFLRHCAIEFNFKL